MTPPVAPDAFERWYSAITKPAGRSRWMRIDLLIVALVAVGSLNNALNPSTGLLCSALPASAVALLVTAAFLWRRQAPLAVAVLAMAGLVLDGARTPVFIALFNLARYQPRHRAIVLTVVGTVSVPLKTLLPGEQGGTPANNLLTAAFYSLLPIVFGLGGRAYARSIVALREERERRVAQTRAEERVRLAREMHDVLGHRIAIIAMHAGALEFVPGVKPESRQVARAIGDTARAGLRDLRQVLGALRDGDDSVIAGHCLSDLEELVADARASGLPVTLATDVAGPVPPELALTAYRTVQEALTNVVKHAPEARTEVRVTADRGRLETMVRNDPSPVPARRIAVAGDGFGMIGLRERVSLLGGEFQAGPAGPGGWRVVTSVPLDRPAASRGH
ncbi:sensor histidine kinase [Kitasatospora sp. NPDC058162]|uniref:sensor histidine kinase n=1 Tax=Kitasatospora sp. NPDC058162 TaxID=3346362 RepID=UPI0036DD2B48